LVTYPLPQTKTQGYLKLFVNFEQGIFYVFSINPAQVNSKHKHRCCSCPKWTDFVYWLMLD